MKYGIANISIIPCRAEASDKSEMVTQLLFGETFKVLEERKKWVRIRQHADQYESWIDRKQWFEISQEQYENLSNANHLHYTTDLVNLVHEKKSSEITPIVMGSSIPNLSNHEFQTPFGTFVLDGAVTKPAAKPQKNLLAEYAYLFLNAPYLWGGRNSFGIDCSGFTQLIYKLIGVSLPRDAYQQAELGQPLSFIEEAEEGDLAFFDNEEGRIIHVGMVLQNNHIIHASGKVRIDRIDHQGIYNREIRDYSHHLRIMKRLV